MSKTIQCPHCGKDIEFPERYTMYGSTEPSSSGSTQPKDIYWIEIPTTAGNIRLRFEDRLEWQLAEVKVCKILGLIEP